MFKIPQSQNCKLPTHSEVEWPCLCSLSTVKPRPMGPQKVMPALFSRSFWRLCLLKESILINVSWWSALAVHAITPTHEEPGFLDSLNLAMIFLSCVINGSLFSRAWRHFVANGSGVLPISYLEQTASVLCSRFRISLCGPAISVKCRHSWINMERSSLVIHEYHIHLTFTWVWGDLNCSPHACQQGL